jgi:hypothetical protein
VAAVNNCQGTNSQRFINIAPIGDTKYGVATQSVKLAEAVKTAKSFKVDHAKKFAQHVVPEVVRPARIIWNQAIGAIFGIFAFLFFGYTVKYVRALNTPATNPVALAFSAFLGAIMLFFAWSSFRAAKRVNQR